MAYPDVAKPATDSSEPALNVEQLGGTLNSKDSKTPSDAQAESVFGRRVVVIRDPIGERFRTRAPR
jgi:hypothetical protein